MPLAPKYFPRMKEINRQGPELLLDKLPRMRECESGAFLDIRRMD